MKFALFLALSFATLTESVAVRHLPELESNDEFVAAQIESETATTGVDCCKKNPEMPKGQTRMHIIAAPRKEVITHSIAKNGDHVSVAKM